MLQKTFLTLNKIFGFRHAIEHAAFGINIANAITNDRFKHFGSTV